MAIGGALGTNTAKQIKTPSESENIVGKLDTILSRLRDTTERVSSLRARSSGIPPEGQANTPKQVWDNSLAGQLNRLNSEYAECLDSIQENLEAIEKFI